MRLHRTLTLILGLSALLASGAAASSDVFFNGKEDGWFWYKDPPEPPKKKEEPKKEEPPPAPVKEEPKKELPPFEVKPPLFSVEWFRKNMDKLKVLAIDDPSPDNISAYLYAQRVMLERSDNFATLAARASQTDPYLDENNRVPFSTAMRSLVMRGEDTAKKEALKQLSKKAGIFFFFDSRCKFCLIQQQMINAFADQYGFVVFNISVDGKPLPGMTSWRKDDGKFRALGLTITPTMVLAVPPDQYLVLAQGSMSADLFEGRALVAAEDRQLLPPDVLKTTRAYDKGRISPDDLKALGIDVDPDNPKSWIEFIRKTLGTAY